MQLFKEMIFLNDLALNCLVMAVIFIVKAHQFHISTTEQAKVQKQNNFLDLEESETLQASTVIVTSVSFNKRHSYCLCKTSPLTLQLKHGPLISWSQYHLLS